MWYESVCCCCLYSWLNCCYTRNLFHETWVNEFFSLSCCCFIRQYLFKGDFIAICQALNLNYEILAKYNHNRLTVEHFPRFLNKSVTIASEEPSTNNTIAAEYNWNSVPIDGTDILRSIPAIGQELHFPLKWTLMLFLSWLRIMLKMLSNILSLLSLLVIFPNQFLILLRTVESLTLNAQTIRETLLC